MIKISYDILHLRMYAGIFIFISVFIKQRSGLDLCNVINEYYVVRVKPITHKFTLKLFNFYFYRLRWNIFRVYFDFQVLSFLYMLKLLIYSLLAFHMWFKLFLKHFKKQFLKYMCMRHLKEFDTKSKCHIHLFWKEIYFKSTNKISSLNSFAGGINTFVSL